MARFEDAIGYVLEHEGGFVDHEADPGGPTKFGVSLRRLVQEGLEWDLDDDGDVDRHDVKLLTVDQARGFYREHYWFPKLDGMRQIVANKVFDMTVNMGRRQATEILQRAIAWFDQEITVDGIFGSQTAKLARQCDTLQLFRAIQAEQGRFYLHLVDRRPQLEVFLKGWLRRAYS